MRTNAKVILVSLRRIVVNIVDVCNSGLVLKGGFLSSISDHPLPPSSHPFYFLRPLLTLHPSQPFFVFVFLTSFIFFCCFQSIFLSSFFVVVIFKVFLLPFSLLLLLLFSKIFIFIFISWLVDARWRFCGAGWTTLWID